MPDTWSPSLYTRFEDERTRPARDLLAQVPLAEARHVVDMGCGPGNSTELLVERFAGAEVIGLDSSPAMLADARKRLPEQRFELADAGQWVPDGETDLVFANAIYQWVPNHMDRLPKVLAALHAGGVLAVQVPDNFGEPSHELMRRVAHEGDWAERLQGVERPLLPPVGAYYDALKPFASRLDIWHTIYNHPLAGPEAIIEWVRSTGLRPFLDRLGTNEQKLYLERYLAYLTEAYPPAVDGKVLLRFPRLFIVARR